MVVYDRLWETMKKKNISQYKLIQHYKIGAGQVHRLKVNEYVTTHTINRLCSILDCRVEDIIEYREDPK